MTIDNVLLGTGRLTLHTRGWCLWACLKH